MASRLVERVDPRASCRPAIALQVCGDAELRPAGAVGAPAWTYAVAIFVAVLSNGGIMGSSAALAMGYVREVAGAGSAILGFSQFALGAVVSPLVGLGGEDSALAPAAGDGGCSLLAGPASRVARRAA